MKSQFIQDVEAFAQQMADRLPVTNEGGIIIMAVDDTDVAHCVIAKPSHRKDMVQRLLCDEDIQGDILNIISDNQ